MPRYSFLNVPLGCPNCDTELTDLMWFDWGYSDASQPVGTNAYRPGEAIRWKLAADGTVPAWTGFSDPRVPAYEGYNMGDPTIADLVVLDDFLGNPDGGNCSKCGHRYGGGAIEIRSGIIQRAWLFAPGEFAHQTDFSREEIYEIGVDGTYHQRLLWPSYRRIEGTAYQLTERP